MSQHEGFSPVQAKGSSKVFILSHPFSPRKGVQTALTQHKWPFKSELLGIHTMTAENLEGTGFLPI